MPADLSLFKKDKTFRGFQPKDWEVISNLLEESSFKAKTPIFKENDHGDGFYWIYQGKVRISRRFIPEGKKEPQENLITVLGPGHLFGEMALIEQGPRSADATADTDTTVFFFSYMRYRKLCSEYPSTAMAIQDILIRTLCSRIREANRNFETIYFWCS